MSLVTNTNQSSSNVAIRLEKLQNLYQVLTNNEPNQHIAKVFTNLEKIDRQAVRTMSSAETIVGKYIINKIAMRNAVKRHMGALKKAEQVFQIGVVKDQTKSQGALTHSSKQKSKNPLPKLPQDVLAENVLPFLTREEATNFQTACVGYSSLTASRFHRLNTLSQAIAQDRAEIPVLFQGLHKDDRRRILENFKEKKFDWNQMKGRKEPLLKMIELMKTEHSFTIPSSKSLVNYLKKLAIPVMSASVGSFLTEKESGDLRSSCKATRKIQPASSIIRAYHLEDLIETYLHVSSSALTPSDKAKALHKLLSMAYSLSEIEELPRPTYSSLPAFFQEVEARNLIRMIEAIRRARPLPHLPAEIEDLHIPNDPTATTQKADRLRVWINQHQGAIAAIDGGLDLTEKGLSLLPKEIGQLKALQELHLENNGLVSVPKEIGQLQALEALFLHSNRLVSVPKEIGQLQALQDLYLQYNRLVSVPKEIGQLQALQELYLQYNRLVSIPKEIGQLKALKALFLSDNHLISIPKEIGKLQALEVLKLINNRLVSIPKGIGHLKELYHLSLENNGLISLPPELDRFNGALKQQNKRLQVKNFLGRLSLYVTGQHNTKKIATFLKAMEKLLGTETRNQLHRCLYEVAQEAAKADKTLRKKLKDNQFGRKAFLGKSIDPKLKAAAIAKFRKTLGE